MKNSNFIRNFVWNSIIQMNFLVKHMLWKFIWMSLQVRRTFLPVCSMFLLLMVKIVVLLICYDVLIILQHWAYDYIMHVTTTFVLLPRCFAGWIQHSSVHSNYSAVNCYWLSVFWLETTWWLSGDIDLSQHKDYDFTATSRYENSEYEDLNNSEPGIRISPGC